MDASRLANAVLQEPQAATTPKLDLEQMIEYIRRTHPDLFGQYVQSIIGGQSASFDPPKPFNQVMSERLAVGDPFGLTRGQRFFGFDPGDKTRLNEAHGLANQENSRYWGK